MKELTLAGDGLCLEDTATVSSAPDCWGGGGGGTLSSFVMGCGGGAFLAPPGLAGVGDMKAVDRVGGPLREPRGSDPINPPPPRLGLRRLGVLVWIQV